MNAKEIGKVRAKVADLERVTAELRHAVDALTLTAMVSRCVGGKRSLRDSVGLQLQSRLDSLAVEALAIAVGISDQMGGG